MPKSTLPPLARRVRDLRERAGLSVQVLAARAGLGRQSVYDVEQGRAPDPHWSTVQALALALGVATDELRDS